MNLYRRKILGANLALVVLAVSLGFSASAQRRKPHKLRATALVELTAGRGGTTTARLIPITILDDGSFHDAGIYKGTPQPMAITGGVVYEAQKTGQVMGYVTLDRASKDRNGNWLGEGKWKTANTPPKPQPTASSPSSSVDERPVLHRGTAPAASPTPAPGAQGESSPSNPPPSGDDRPVLHRTPSAAPPQAAPSPSPTAAPAGTPAPAPETAATPDEAQEDPNRPTLRHRTPQQSRRETGAPPAASPAVSAGSTAPNPAAAPKPSPSPATPASGTQLVAVSDEQANEARSYDFVWKQGERQAVEAKMRRLAQDQVSDKDGAPADLTNVVIRAFDLDLSNDAVMVVTAEAPPGPVPAAKPATKAGAKAAAGAQAPPSAPARATRYITVIARVDFEGNPQKLAASVTDSSRLDVVPRLELIDAVDVDGDGLAELLFRQYSFDEKSFVIFSIGRSTVTKLFEGASQALK